LWGRSRSSNGIYAAKTALLFFYQQLRQVFGYLFMYRADLCSIFKLAILHSMLMLKILIVLFPMIGWGITYLNVFKEFSNEGKNDGGHTTMQDRTRDLAAPTCLIMLTPWI
jgi:hypothetical protein